MPSKPPFGLPPLDTRCDLCGEPEYLFGLCYRCAKAQYADEDEPDQYQEGDGDEAEDHRLDDPRHGQAESINRERHKP